MRNLCLLLLTLILGTPALGEQYTFDQKHSTIGFEIGHLTGTARGVFKQFEGTLILNPDDSKVKVTIQVDSIDTDSAKRDAHLQEEEYFYTAKYPTITFESVSFKKRGDQYVVTGPLTIRGVSKNITLRVTLERKQAQWAIGGDALYFDSNYEINRLDFGVNGGQPAVGEQVKINLAIKAFEVVP